MIQKAGYCTAFAFDGYLFNYTENMFSIIEIMVFKKMYKSY